MIELLVVLAIVAVIVTISVPTIASMTSPEHALRKDGRQLMLLMQEARSVAMNRKLRVDVMVDPLRNEVRAVERSVRDLGLPTDDFYATIERDSEEWELAMSNRFERVLQFSEETLLDGFSVDEIDVLGDDDDPFQEEPDRDVFEPDLSPETAFLAVTFTHFGGSDGGGVSLIRDSIRLDVAADILTGRPRLVQRKPETLGGTIP